MAKKGKFKKLKNHERKTKSTFMFYKDFESILVPEDNEKQNPEESYMSKYQKHIACSYGYKLVCVNDKFSKPFKTYSGEDAVYNFINSMIKETRYCSDMMKKHFNKELVMTKEENEIFENSTKCWICHNDYISNDLETIVSWHVAGRYRGSAHRDCNIKS